MTAHHGPLRAASTKDRAFKAGKGDKSKRIFLHWTGGFHNSPSSSYHTTFTGDGKAHRYTENYGVYKGTHTGGANTNSVGLSIAAMGHQGMTANYYDENKGWAENPPTGAQIQSMALEAARLAHAWGWTESTIKSNVMTHGEWERYATSNNILPGRPQRWDLDQLRPGQPFDQTKTISNGGNEMRALITAYFKKIKQAEETGSERLGTTTSSSKINAKPLTKEQKEQIYELTDKMVKIGFDKGTGEKVKFPGIGTFVSGKNFFGQSTDKYFDLNGRRISKKEFLKRLDSAQGKDGESSNLDPKSSPSTSDSETNSAGTYSGKIQYFSSNDGVVNKSLLPGKSYSFNELKLHHGQQQPRRQDGWPRDYTLLHGTNLASSPNADIPVPLDSTVTHKQSFGGYGNTVIVKNATGNMLFAHLSKYGNIKVGDKIKAGTIIGTQGSTGGNYADHLHLDAEKEGHEAFVNFITGKKATYGSSSEDSNVNLDPITSPTIPLTPSTTPSPTPSTTPSPDPALKFRKKYLKESLLSERKLLEKILKIEGNKGTLEEVKLPGVGTFKSGKNWLKQGEDKYFDESGRPLSKEEFLDRFFTRSKNKRNELTNILEKLSLTQPPTPTAPSPTPPAPILPKPSILSEPLIEKTASTMSDQEIREEYDRLRKKNPVTGMVEGSASDLKKAEDFGKKANQIKYGNNFVSLPKSFENIQTSASYEDPDQNVMVAIQPIIIRENSGNNDMNIF